MTQESMFRTSTAALFVSALLISIYHRHKADMIGGRVSWQEEGLLTVVLLRVCGLAAWLSVLTYLLNPHWMQWSSLHLPSWLRWCGVPLGVVTLPLIYWVFISIGHNITPTVTTRKDHQLVTTGAYRWVRHPLYSVGSLFFVALNLLVANWFVGIACFLGLIMILVRLPKEEAILIKRFGDEYRAYRKCIGRLLPRISSPP
ncbi:MAG TPA: isoprenylcysteine carboxylmethyltransferase family protein [Abditibacteriaceae bacterium]|jgi:protein-S-isoprenylcysteine O-methyltransferase Ste14